MYSIIVKKFCLPTFFKLDVLVEYLILVKWVLQVFMDQNLLAAKIEHNNMNWDQLIFVYFLIMLMIIFFSIIIILCRRTFFSFKEYKDPIGFVIIARHYCWVNDLHEFIFRFEFIYLFFILQFMQLVLDWFIWPQMKKTHFSVNYVLYRRKAPRSLDCICLFIERFQFFVIFERSYNYGWTIYWLWVNNLQIFVSLTRRVFNNFL